MKILLIQIFNNQYTVLHHPQITIDIPIFSYDYCHAMEYQVTLSINHCHLVLLAPTTMRSAMNTDVKGDGSFWEEASCNHQTSVADI